MSKAKIAPPIHQEQESQRVVELQEHHLVPTAEVAIVSSMI